ncbi:GntR family transcriptional regulator [Algicella marina]|uniref:FCD domain-containing protein n=1 Tax=Algicella marina TaxID=2683284 RepID=A0A6P1SXV3_9RHOB|nr:GntR family transcriptional regulator [Algicella marina]QHQ34375.1 FCD domain-containing protein [Algicella marina]
MQDTPEQEPLSLTEHVADKLREMVIRGQLAPGQHIVERKLCAELSVSRTPMREALKLLRQDGLVEIFRNRGARVAPYTAEDAIDLFEVISGMESIAASRAAERITDTELDALQEQHARIVHFHKTGNLDDYFPANSAVHAAILRIAANPVLANAHRRLMLLAQRGRYMAIMNPERWNQAVSEHGALMASLEARDPDAAREIWSGHLMNTGISVAAALRADSEQSDQQAEF